MTMIDLRTLPAPDALEMLDYESVLAEKKELLLSLMPDHKHNEVMQTLALESEPLTILLQAYAYDNLVLRQRINEATASTHLAYAQKNDLELQGFPWGLTRKVIQEANPDIDPPIPEILESDDDLRRRIQMAPNKLSTAGPILSYVGHTLDAHELIKDASITRPIAGTVRVHIMAYTSDGKPSQEVLDAAYQYLSDETRRPTCDTVEVVAATAKPIEITYQITYFDGPEKEQTKVEARKRLDKLIKEKQRLGETLALVHINGALSMPGVIKAKILTPTSDIECQRSEYPLITKVEEVD